MEKKMVGILAGVAAVHVVLLAGLMASGGCRQPEILGNQTYNDGPALAEPAESAPALNNAPSVPETEAPETPSVSSTGKYPGLSSVTPSKAAKSAAVAGTSTYKVAKGDTLSGIAYKHGVKTRELMACNNLTEKSVLRIGQELKIPEGGAYHADRAAAPKAAAKSTKSTKNTASTAVKSDKSGVKAAPTAAAPADGIHVVASGDTLDRIARKYGVTAKAIAQENSIALNKVLHIGDKLRIPGKAAAGAAKTDAGLPLTDNMDLDPNIGLTPTAGTTPAGAAPVGTAPTETTAPVPGTNLTPAPAGTTPGAAVGTAAGVTAGTTGLANTETLQVPNDMTADQFCKMYNVKMEDLKRLNPDLPADGNLKGGAHMIVPTL